MMVRDAIELRDRGQSTATKSTRLIAAFVAAGCLAVLFVGSRLDPDPRGHATHQQLGLGPCGWAMVFNKPCPTCGMTTSVAHAARLDLVSAFKAQPMGLLIALAAATFFWPALHVAAFGSNLGRYAAILVRPRVLWTLGGISLAAWAYKFYTWSG